MVATADGSLGRELQDLAMLRAAAILVDTASYSEIVQRLEPLTAPDRTFRHSARAVLANMLRSLACNEASNSRSMLSPL